MMGCDGKDHHQTKDSSNSSSDEEIKWPIDVSHGGRPNGVALRIVRKNQGSFKPERLGAQATGDDSKH